LLFNGSLDRYVRALDADTGAVVWDTRLPGRATGGPMTYSVNGRQYVAIAAGNGPANFLAGMTPEVDTGNGENAMYVFALPQN
jgi:alcohol dehydrogenase (cytochrome c)